jgi:hypothetical protein
LNNGLVTQYKHLQLWNWMKTISIMYEVNVWIYLK